MGTPDSVEFLRFRVCLLTESMAILLCTAQEALQQGELHFAEVFLTAARISEHEALISRYKLRQLLNKPRVGIKTSQLMYEEGWAHKPLQGRCWCYDCTYGLIEKKLPARAS